MGSEMCIRDSLLGGAAELGRVGDVLKAVRIGIWFGDKLAEALTSSALKVHVSPHGKEFGTCSALRIQPMVSMLCEEVRADGSNYPLMYSS